MASTIHPFFIGLSLRQNDNLPAGATTQTLEFKYIGKFEAMNMVPYFRDEMYGDVKCQDITYRDVSYRD
jgi:hypothetical protein